ncbi:MAG: uroporphyrinogen decarboxylase family protein [Saccharofermentanales bacterium]
MMTSRERVFAALDFKKTDRIPCDITDGRIWPELNDYFRSEFGFETNDEILNFLDTDFRWIEPVYRPQKKYADQEIIARNPPQQVAEADPENQPKDMDCSAGPLSSVETLDDLDKAYKIKVLHFDNIDFKAFRKKWPDYAIAIQSFAKAYFWESCAQFGSTEVFYKINDFPEVYDAFLRKLEVESTAILVNFLEAAKDDIDIVAIWDDFAGQNGMMVDPDWWRRVLKPYYKREIELIHSFGKKVFFHSCGDIRPVLEDMIDIGVDAMTVFQVNAKDMDPDSISMEFGGRLCFYGGIDVQQLLSYGSPDDVTRQARHNIDCFRDCGGYIIANCHSHISTIRGDNLVAMCKVDRQA